MNTEEPTSTQRLRLRASSNHQQHRHLSFLQTCKSEWRHQLLLFGQQQRLQLLSLRPLSWISLQLLQRTLPHFESTLQRPTLNSQESGLRTHTSCGDLLDLEEVTTHQNSLAHAKQSLLWCNNLSSHSDPFGVWDVHLTNI